MTTVSVNKVLEQQNVDAALYLLERMLGLDTVLLRERRTRLQQLQARVRKSRRISQGDRQFIATTFREVIG